MNNICHRILKIKSKKLLTILFLIKVCYAFHAIHFTLLYYLMFICYCINLSLLYLQYNNKVQALKGMMELRDNWNTVCYQKEK